MKRILIGGSPCVPAGTKVKVFKLGYKKIEDIQEGDLVLTHNNRYKKVLKTMTRKTDHLYEIKFNGSEVLKITGNHPLYIYEGGEFIWKAAQDVKVGDYLAINIPQESNAYPFGKEILWLLGRFVSDGYIDKQPNRRRVYFCVGQKKVEEFEKHLNNANLHYYVIHKDRPASEYIVEDEKLFRWLDIFEFGAANKQVPDEILELPDRDLKEFFNGYFSGDGHKRQDRAACYMWSTISEDLVLSMGCLTARLFSKYPTVTRKKEKGTKVWSDGRTSVCHDSFNSQVSLGGRISKQMIVGDKIIIQIKGINKKNTECNVYNLSVEDDESYTVNNVIVHNCTHWSIAQKFNRETKPEGMGWELFKNFLIAKEKFKPDFFLYENNESASAEIKEQISKELGYPLTHINAALVSAQNRKRIYCTNVPVPQPEDRGILLKDILDSGVVDKEKAYCLKHQAGNARDYLKKHHTGVAFEPVCVAQRGRYDEEGKVFQHYEASEDGKTNTLTTVSKDNLVAEPIPFNPSSDGKCRTIKAQYGKSSMANFTSTGNYGATGVIEPVRIGDIDTTAQAHRVYSPYGKSVNLTANGGGQGAKTGLYMTPVSLVRDEYKPLTEKEMGYMLRETADGRNHFDYGYIQDTTKDKSKCVLANLHKGVPYNVMAETVEYVDLDSYSDVEYFDNGNIKINGKMIYLVKDGQIGYNDNFYPIKLPDGYYLIRKLTPEECEKLMTLPVGYTKVKGNSNTQRFKQLGNGWVAEVIMHIMRQWNIPLDEEIEVLSMYDGIATGRYCLDKLGYKNVTYKAAEVDKYAINVATTNWPDIIEIGDAFQVREEGWNYDGDDQRLEVS